jgi:hypothetical protein
MTSELNLWYLNDGTIGGELRNLLHDLDTVRRVGATLGLLLSDNKCEIVTNDDVVVSMFRAVMTHILHIPCSDAVLLGTPIGDESSIDPMLHSKLTNFQRLDSRLETLNAQDALFLLRNSVGFTPCDMRRATIAPSCRSMTRSSNRRYKSS